MLISAVKRIFSVAYMVKPKDRVGEIPSSRETYFSFIDLAWPAMIESLFVAFAGFIDTMMVSRASDTAIAAVGITTQPRMILYLLFFAMNSATIAIVSRRFGEKNQEGANRCIAQTFSISLMIAVLELIPGILFAEPFLRFAGAQDDTIAEALIYFRITILGLMFYSLSTVLNAAQRGTGNTKVTMRSSLTGNIINVILNYFLIGGIWIFPKFGVTGAAIATLIGHFCSFLISLAAFFEKKSYLRLRPSYFFRFEKTTMQAILRVGSGAGVEQLFVRFGLFMFAKVVADLGTEAMTAHQICMNIVNLSFACGDGLGSAAAAMVGRYLGCGRPDISLIYGKVAQRIAWFFSAVLFTVFTTCRRLIVLPFTDDPKIVAAASQVLIVIAFVSLAQVSQCIFTGSLRGAGDTRFNAVVSFVSTDIVRPILAYLLGHLFGFGLLGTWFALLVDQYTRFICVTAYFYSGRWKRIKL